MLYVLAALALYALLVFVGDLECLEGTVLDDLSYFLTYGVASIVQRILGALVGSNRARRAMATCSVCESSPVGQLVFVALYALSVAGICVQILPHVSPAERLLAVMYMSMVLALFIMTSRSNPGIVTPANATRLLQLFPADGVLRREQACQTCMLMRPARAKHHGPHCIACFDHYCVWMRNTIGLFNMRYFLMFLVVTSIACAHGALIGAQLIYRDIYIVRGWRPTDRQVLFRILANRYQLSSALVAFLFVCAVTLFLFFSMHLMQICRDLTTYEGVKLRQMGIDVRRRYYRKGVTLDLLKVILRPNAYLAQAGGALKGE